MFSIILAAGQGKRMRPLSFIIPKVLLPVRGKPVLDYLMGNLRGMDIEHHYIVASEQIEVIQNYLEKTGAHKVSVVRGLGWETGGDLAIALQEINKKDDFVVMNGDIITDVDISKLYEFHKSKEAAISMALLELNDDEEAKRFGQIELGDDGVIKEFREKNDDEMRKSNLVNVGFYIFSGKLIEERPDCFIPRKFKLETELFPLLSKQQMLYGSRMDINYWWDVGTVESYLKAEEFFINGRNIIPP